MLDNVWLIMKMENKENPVLKPNFDWRLFIWLFFRLRVASFWRERIVNFEAVSMNIKYNTIVPRDQHSRLEIFHIAFSTAEIVVWFRPDNFSNFKGEEQESSERLSSWYKSFQRDTKSSTKDFSLNSQRVKSILFRDSFLQRILSRIFCLSLRLSGLADYQTKEKRNISAIQVQRFR